VGDATGAGAGVGVATGVGDGVATGVGAGVGVATTTGVGVGVGVATGVAVGAGVGVTTGVVEAVCTESPTIFGATPPSEGDAENPMVALPPGAMELFQVLEPALIT
jgi:hypothetical protein